MYGAAHTLPYTVFLTDLQSLWVDAPTVLQVSSEAARGGLQITTEKLAYLVEKLVKSVNEGEFECDLKQKIIKGKVDELKWTFTLAKADEAQTCSFLSAFSTRSLDNHAKLIDRISALERRLQEKDKYIMYLEENYKTINGSDLIDRYKPKAIEHSDRTSLAAVMNDPVWETTLVKPEKVTVKIEPPPAEEPRVSPKRRRMGAPRFR